MRSHWLTIFVPPRNTQTYRLGWSHAVEVREYRPLGQMNLHQVYRSPTSVVVDPVVEVAEESQLEPVRGSGSYDFASSVEEAGYMPGFFPNLLDPILPISLETLREEDPAVVVALFHATRSSLVTAAAVGGWESDGFATGSRRGTAVEVLEYMVAGNPSWHPILAVILVDSSNGRVVRQLTEGSVDSCWIAHRLGPLCLLGASVPPRVPGYMDFRQLI